jgi:preprotein translocase subunit Sec61beta
MSATLLAFVCVVELKTTIPKNQPPGLLLRKKLEGVHTQSAGLIGYFDEPAFPGENEKRSISLDARFVAQGRDNSELRLQAYGETVVNGRRTRYEPLGVPLDIKGEGRALTSFGTYVLEARCEIAKPQDQR